MENPIWLSFFLTWSTLTWGIYRLFNAAGDTVEDKSKLIVSKWLLNLPNENNQIKDDNWISVFIKLFDSIFGQKHFSWRCFVVSSIASSISYGLILLLFYPLYKEFGIHVLPYFILPVTINIIIDYISLLETRYLLNRFKKTYSIFVLISYIALDIILTMVIFIIIWIFAYHFIIMPILKPYVPYVNYGIEGWTENTSDGRLRIICLLTTFFTSAWLWIYILGSIIVKVINSIFGTIGFFQDHLKIKEKPFRAIGMVLICIVTIIYIIWGINLFILK